MSDISITAANVIPSSGARRILKVIDTGVTVTAGQAVYLDATSKKLKLADADALASANAAGIAELGGGAGQQIPVIYEDDALDLGATLVVGETYVVSTTAGGIAPLSDLLTGDFTTILGVATAADALKLRILVSGTARATDANPA